MGLKILVSSIRMTLYFFLVLFRVNLRCNNGWSSVLSQKNIHDFDMRQWTCLTFKNNFYLKTLFFFEWNVIVIIKRIKYFIYLLIYLISTFHTSFAKLQ